MILKHRKQATIRLISGSILFLVGMITLGCYRSLQPTPGSLAPLVGIVGTMLSITGYLLYVFGCVDLLKAKGYDSSVSLAFLIPAFCCCLFFIFFAAPIILFGLTDKTNSPSRAARPMSRPNRSAKPLVSDYSPIPVAGRAVVSDSSSKNRPAASQHSDFFKAILGIGGGLALTSAAQAGSYVFDPQNRLIALWVILALFTWPVMGFGEYHFARHRGYNGAAGVGLLLVASVFSMFLILLLGVHATRKPFVFLLIHLFVAAFPIAVLLALPRKNFYPNKMKNRK